jgi:hypothetical protein
MRIYPENPALRWRQSLLRRHGVVALLLVGFVLMCALAFEQDRTITNQRELIHSLFRDSLELNAMKMQQAQSTKHR